MNKYITIILTILVVLAIATPSISAQTPCTIIFGGGLKPDGSAYCMEAISTTKPTPMPGDEYSQTPNGFPSQTRSQGSGQSKGGLAVQSSPSMQNQPATGPESLALFGMIPAAALGWFLRRKAV